MQANESYRLIVRRGPQPNQVYELSGDITNLGRDITNDIVINDREVSRHHLRLMQGSEGYTIEDLGSTNGTFINGKRISGAQALKNGDMIGLGETVTLQYEVARPGAGAPAPQPPTDESRYRPPAQSEPSAQPFAQPQQPPAQDAPPPAASPYQAPPQEGYPQAQPQPGGYQEPQQQYVPQDAYQPPAPEYAAPPVQGSYGPPPPAGYDYDPYAMRDEEGGGAMQWVLIGCTGLILLCCCATVIAAVAVDTLCLYDSIPGLTNVLDALGIAVQCGG